MPTQSRNTLLLATDRQNSVLNAVGVTGVDAIPYTAYGHSPLDASQSRLRFNGEFQELMTGYYPLGQGYRMYSPILRRFISPDGYAFSPFGRGGRNAYAYCDCDPVNRADPTGHAWGFLKAIGRNLGLRTSNKAKLADKFNAGFGRVSPSALFTNDSLKEAAKLGEPRQLETLKYNKKTNTLNLTRNVQNEKFSFTSTVEINSTTKQLSPEILTSITPIEELASISRSTSEYVDEIQNLLTPGRPIGRGAINRVLHPKVLKNQQKAIRESYTSWEKHRALPKETPDPNRFLYRSGGF